MLDSRPWLRLLLMLGANLGFSLLIVVLPFLPDPFGQPQPPSALLTALLTSSALFTWLRFWWPGTALTLCTAVACLALPIGSPLSGEGALFAVALCCYSIAVAWPPRRMLLGLGAAATSTIVVEGLSGNPVEAFYSVAMPLALAAALGSWVRVRRSYIEELSKRAAQAEATRESEAARRVSEERLRIAQDLHDVVAHQITVINLHAGLASSQLDRNPAKAKESLATAREASRRILSDIGNLLTMLRGDDAPPAPQSRLADLDQLLAEFRDSGLEVAVHRTGHSPVLSPSVDQVAHQILREALTNALRHGAKRQAHVEICGTPTQLELLVTNPSTGERGVDESGHGLVGVRERAASVAGTVETDDGNGMFRLRAVLPAGGTQ